MRWPIVPGMRITRVIEFVVVFAVAIASLAVARALLAANVTGLTGRGAR